MAKYKDKEHNRPRLSSSYWAWYCCSCGEQCAPSWQDCGVDERSDWRWVSDCCSDAYYEDVADKEGTGD